MNYQLLSKGQFVINGHYWYNLSYNKQISYLNFII